MLVASLIAIAVIVAGLAWGWSRRFLASGALALTNLVVFAITAFNPFVRLELGLWSGNVYAAEPFALVQLITSMFIHADLAHLIGNLFILLVFSIVFEDLIGPRRLIVVYLATGILAAVSQLGVSWGDPMLLMGASGAVAGIVGAFAGAYPHMVMRLPIPGPIIFFARMRVMTYAVLFALIQILLQFGSRYIRSLGGVAYAAHLGGLAAGLALGFWWLKRATASKEAPTQYPLDELDRYAQDTRTKRALAEMRANHDEPEVFGIWAERFWDGARDPVTGQPVRLDRKGQVVPRD